jgi:hypothetical protein
MMKKLIVYSLLFVAFGWQAAGACRAQETAREGYVRTADGVRLFYKIVGDGAETLVETFLKGGWPPEAKTLPGLTQKK